MAWGKMSQKDQNFEIWVTFEVAQKFWGCPKNQFCASWACYWTKGVQTWHAWTWTWNWPESQRYWPNSQRSLSGIKKLTWKLTWNLPNIERSQKGNLMNVHEKGHGLNRLKKQFAFQFSINQSNGLNPTARIEIWIEWNRKICPIQNLDWNELNALNRTKRIESDWIGPNWIGLNALNRTEWIEIWIESDRLSRTDWLNRTESDWNLNLKSEIANAWRLTLRYITTKCWKLAKKFLN